MENTEIINFREMFYSLIVRSALVLVVVGGYRLKMRITDLSFFKLNELYGRLNIFRNIKNRLNFCKV